ncbi:HlyD family efflux transporter periplasmic adaptor subunit [Leekyejoonella antrihumi]|uniref:efflux RND transporter periplasmic adaptor subunit n=1 Tax=Leekyejoonella antrihumi TaxID=1660198 RepID=UPI001C96849E
MTTASATLSSLTSLVASVSSGSGHSSSGGGPGGSSTQGGSQPTKSTQGGSSAAHGTTGSQSAAAPTSDSTTTPNGTSSGKGASAGGSAATSAESGQGGGGSGGSSAASIAQAQLAVTQAEQASAGATLTTPIDGVVAAVGMTAGQDATSSSSITIVGQGDAQITLQASLTQLPSLSVGQTAQVSAPGALGTIAASVTQIGILPSSTSSPTYPVTVVVPDAPPPLASGTSVQVAVDTKTATNAVTVPVSALAMLGNGRASVQVANGTSVTTTIVGVGAIGDGRAQVTNGLKAGQSVVLADLTSVFPSNESGSTSSLTGRGFSGGGGGGGRFGGSR